ncbi:hypothetical protein [Sphingobacterium tabacisoli]|uniref:hypothetical protein n=1 Tax=Sphingobacterium tabacisoli TaxID=2044855 RepID=UPI0036D38DAC
MKFTRDFNFYSKCNKIEFVNKLEESVSPGDVGGLTQSAYDAYPNNDLIGLVNFEDFQISYPAKGFSLEPIAYGYFTDEENGFKIDVHIKGISPGFKIWYSIISIFSILFFFTYEINSLWHLISTTALPIFFFFICPALWASFRFRQLNETLNELFVQTEELCSIESQRQNF